jgi:hypothetical protein
MCLTLNRPLLTVTSVNCSFTAEKFSLLVGSLGIWLHCWHVILESFVRVYPQVGLM